MPKVEVISRKRLLDDFFKVDEAHLRFEQFDGTMSNVVRRLNFERGDAVAALLVNAERRSVYLVQQFMYPTLEKAGGWLDTVVAGMIDAGETPEQAARREIVEESGFTVDKVEPIASFFLSPGGSSERIFLFAAVVSEAARTAKGGGLASENEDIKVMEWPVDEFLARVTAGGLHDAKTIIAGHWLKDNLARLVR
jgi:ADP-ribose pyrophosphatase